MQKNTEVNPVSVKSLNKETRSPVSVRSFKREIAFAVRNIDFYGVFNSRLALLDFSAALWVRMREPRLNSSKNRRVLFDEAARSINWKETSTKHDKAEKFFS